MLVNRKFFGALAIGSTLLVAAAACSSTSKSTPAVQTAASTHDVVTAIPSLTGTGTSVRLDAGTVAALTSLGVTLAPAGSASFDAATATITFPITSGYAEIHSDLGHVPGYIVGSIEHTGSGFTLSAGKTTVALSDFVVDPGNSVLYGTVNGTTHKVPLLTLDGTNVKVSKDASGDVVLDGTVAELTDTAANALNQAFKTSALKAGIKLGTVHLVAKGTANTYDAGADKTAEITRLAGTGTSVALDASTAAALKSLGVSLAPQGSATFDSATSTVSFPITGGFAAIHSVLSYQPGYIAGVVLHEGSGLTFTKGTKSLTVQDFVVDPGDSILTGSVGSKSGIPLLVLDGTNVKVGTQGSDVLLDGTVARLTDTAAQALNATFGVTAFQAGIPLGVVHLVASGN
jgi:hypothetical protein